MARIIAVMLPKERCTNQENAVLTVSCQGGIFHSFQCYVCCFSRMVYIEAYIENKVCDV
jgi:hypothetical protein